MSESGREAYGPHTSDRPGPQCVEASGGSISPTTRQDFPRRKQPRMVEPAVSGSKATAFKIQRVPEYPWRVRLVESPHPRFTIPREVERRRCAGPHRRVAAHPGARVVALELESRPRQGPGRIGRPSPHAPSSTPPDLRARPLDPPYSSDAYRAGSRPRDRRGRGRSLPRGDTRAHCPLHPMPLHQR